MVDHIYYGRGDRGKIKLLDAQVREIVDRRQLAQASLSALLDELAASDPVPDPADRVNGRLLLVVHPVAARAKTPCPSSAPSQLPARRMPRCSGRWPHVVQRELLPRPRLRKVATQPGEQ